MNRREFLKIASLGATSAVLGGLDTSKKAYATTLDENKIDLSHLPPVIEDKNLLGGLFPNIGGGSNLPGILTSVRRSGDQRLFLPHEIVCNLGNKNKRVIDLSIEDLFTLMGGEIQYTIEGPNENKHIAFFPATYMVQKKIKENKFRVTDLGRPEKGIFSYRAKTLNPEISLEQLLSNSDNSDFYSSTSTYSLPIYLDSESLVGYKFIPNEQDVSKLEGFTETISAKHWENSDLQKGLEDIDVKKYITKITKSPEEFKEFLESQGYSQQFLNLLIDNSDNLIGNRIHGGIITPINGILNIKGKPYVQGPFSSLIYDSNAQVGYIGSGIQDLDSSSSTKGIGGLAGQAGKSSSSSSPAAGSPSGFNPGSSPSAPASGGPKGGGFGYLDRRELFEKVYARLEEVLGGVRNG